MPAYVVASGEAIEQCTSPGLWRFIADNNAGWLLYSCTLLRQQRRGFVQLLCTHDALPLVSLVVAETRVLITEKELAMIAVSCGYHP